MAHSYSDNDCDSTFGEGTFLWTDSMFPPSPPLAGTKREADDAVDDSMYSGAGMAADSDSSAPRKAPCYATCCPEQLPCQTVTDSRPSKRRAIHEAAGEQSSLDADEGHHFPDDCFAEFCQECAFETSCNSPCVVPCSDADCAKDDVCRDPNCDQRPQCSDGCMDPECTKVSCPNDPCFCQKCDAQVCPLGEPDNACHLAHTAPSASGTIYCYDNAPCHFQSGHHFGRTTLGTYEGYSCFTPTHETLDPCHVTPHSQPTASPVLSASNYTPLDSVFSGQSSPTTSSSFDPSCLLRVPFDHCHFNNPCCHGDTRACGDTTTRRHQSKTYSKNSTLDNIDLFGSLSFGLPTRQHTNTTSLDQTLSEARNTEFPFGPSDGILSYNDASWDLLDLRLPDSLEGSGLGNQNKLGYLASVVQAQERQSFDNQIAHDIALHTRPSTSMSCESSTACICKWQTSPNTLCLQTFEGPEALHKHIKASHVERCARCICQWEGCESGDKDFKQRSKLSRHLLGHAGYRPYACSFEGCNKSFATNQAKDNHERTHTGVRPYICNHCGYTTTTQTQLQTHVSALHLNQKPHKCRFCSFTCADSSNLSKHERTHQIMLIQIQNLRPYRCPHLNCTFKPDCRWENLKRHLRRSGHCPELLEEQSVEYKAYRENVRNEIDEWQKRNDGTVVAIRARRKGSKT